MNIVGVFFLGGVLHYRIDAWHINIFIFTHFVHKNATQMFYLAASRCSESIMYNEQINAYWQFRIIVLIISYVALCIVSIFCHVFTVRVWPLRHHSAPCCPCIDIFAPQCYSSLGHILFLKIKLNTSLVLRVAAVVDGLYTITVRALMILIMLSRTPSCMSCMSNEKMNLRTKQVALRVIQVAKWIHTKRLHGMNWLKRVL